MKTYEIPGTYCSGKTPTTIFVCENRDGSKWYVTEGGSTINKTYDEIEEGCHVEDLQDVDCFTWTNPISDMDEFIKAVEF